MAEKRTIGLEEENVLIPAGECSVTILPHLGGKIASLCMRGRELLQSPLAPYSPRTQTMAFDEGDASGWDECLPSVAGCTVETAAGPALVPDHGDLWRVAWRQVAGSAGSATFRGACFSLPLTLERTVTLKEEGQGWLLRLEYKVTNTGGYTAPWSWSAHPLFTAEAGDTIVLPDSIRSCGWRAPAAVGWARADDPVSWPIATLTNGSQTDLSVAQPPESGIGDKLFAGPLSETENWCALERPQAGVRIRVRFDTAATPYLGLWICYGGWPDRPGTKQTCVAFEPSTAPVDSLARTGPWSRVLAPGESFSWPMVVELESI